MKKVKMAYSTHFCAKQKNLAEKHSGPCKASY